MEAHNMTVKFFPNDKGNPAGKLADAELHFSGGPLNGLKLVGFGIWERKNGGRNVTFPARQYSVNGERRSFALLRPIVDATSQDKLRDVILEAFKEHEAEMAVASLVAWESSDRVKAKGREQRAEVRNELTLANHLAG
jgi:hypothetical protein